MMADALAPIRVVLADDHPIFLAGIAGLIRDTANIDVVGSAATGGQALKLIAELAPDIAVLDIAMPERSGIEVLRRLRDEGRPVRAIILSTYEERAYVQQALAAGARGYVVKRAGADHLLHAITAVHGGGMYLDPVIAGSHLCVVDSGATAANGQSCVDNGVLSEREEQILKLIAFGHTIKEIAGRLAISSKSIETYKLRATEKLGLRSRAGIVEYAILRGWLVTVAS
jgi:DNA-binding NarL/FixJ family response regulator